MDPKAFWDKKIFFSPSTGREHRRFGRGIKAEIAAPNLFLCPFGDESLSRLLEIFRRRGLYKGPGGVWNSGEIRVALALGNHALGFTDGSKRVLKNLRYKLFTLFPDLIRGTYFFN